MRPETVEAIRRLVNAAGFGQTEAVFVQYRDELAAPEARELLALQVSRHAPGSLAHRVITTRLGALERSIAEGQAAVFAGYDDAAKGLIAILNAPDWQAVRRAIDAQRHQLFPKVADIAFADLAMQSTPDEESQVLGGWTLIEQCRKLGVEAAIETHSQPQRGVILDSETAASLASAASSEELHQRLAAIPEIASRLARRSGSAAQIAQWAGHADYAAAMQALAAPADLEKRIETCRTALATIDRDQQSVLWALVAMDLASSLRRRASNSGTSSMAEPIALYRAVIDRLTAEAEPEQYAHAHRRLGDALLIGAAGSADASLDEAIRCYETALALLRPVSEPREWGTTAAHLMEALLRRTHGDPSVDVDRVAGLAEEAITVLEKTDARAVLASVRVSLAVALTRRVSGSHDENLRRAASQLRTAIEDVEADEHPDIWAMANAHLGSVYLTRARLDLVDREQLLQQAEGCFRDAAGSEDAGPRARARALSGLGWAMSDQNHLGPEGVAEAIAHQHAAIALYESMGDAYTAERGYIHRNLALLHAKRPTATGSHLEDADAQFRAALACFAGDEYRVERRDTLRPMAMMYFDVGQWDDALPCMREAIALSDEMLGGRYTEAGKEAEARENRGLYGPAAYCLVKLGRPGEALQTLESGKARMIAERLVSEADRVARSTEVWKAIDWTRAEIARLDAESRRAEASRDPEHSGRLGRRLRDAWRHLKSLQPSDSGETTTLELRAMLAEIPADGALVVPIVTSRGGVALVVPAGSDLVVNEHVVELPSLDVRTLMEIMVGRAGVGGWLNAYLLALRDSTSDSLLHGLDELGAALWTHLMEPVRARLRELGIRADAPIVLLPSGWLGLLPLHAAGRMVDDRWLAFGQEFVVTYVPSIRALQASRRRLEEEPRRGRRLLAIANPTGDLQFADAEVSDITRSFGPAEEPGTVRVLDRNNPATRSTVLEMVAGRHYLHFACHADFSWTNPAESGLQLAGGDRLGMEDVLSSDLHSSRLVTLSACETGMTEFVSMPDEFIGLPGAFLEAGAPTVISSLWPVDDNSTRLLMSEFYRLHLGGLPVAVALQRAQRWLSDATAEHLGLADMHRRAYEGSGGTNERALQSWRYYDAHPNAVPFGHPYYWAAFTVSGS